MFDESIKRLVKIRRYVAKTQLEQLQDNNFLSTLADEAVYSITLAIKDLARLNNVLRKENDNENKIN